MSPLRLPHLPDLHGESVAALRARTRGAVTSDGLRCWVCYCRRFHQWGSSLRCDKCHTYYISTPELCPPKFAKSCFRCGHRSLLIFPDITGCVKCGQAWGERAPVEYVHIVASAKIVADLVARGRIDPNGVAMPYLYTDNNDTPAKIRRDLRLKEIGLDPALDHRRKKVSL